MTGAFIDVFSGQITIAVTEIASSTFSSTVMSPYVMNKTWLHSLRIHVSIGRSKKLHVNSKIFVGILIWTNIFQSLQSWLKLLGPHLFLVKFDATLLYLFEICMKPKIREYNRQKPINLIRLDRNFQMYVRLNIRGNRTRMFLYSARTLFS